MKVDLRKDISVLTTINESTLSKFNNVIMWCISDSVIKAALNKEDSVNVDIGIGTLKIELSNSNIKYKFVPNQKFNETITNSFINERNELALNLEESLVSKITSTYKNFF